jgi:hypothetical protein
LHVLAKKYEIPTSHIINYTVKAAPVVTCINYTVKAAPVVTFIKRLPFLVLLLKISYALHFF